MSLALQVGVQPDPQWVSQQVEQRVGRNQIKIIGLRLGANSGSDVKYESNIDYGPILKICFKTF